MLENPLVVFARLRSVFPYDVLFRNTTHIQTPLDRILVLLPELLYINVMHYVLKAIQVTIRFVFLIWKPDKRCDEKEEDCLPLTFSSSSASLNFPSSRPPDTVQELRVDSLNFHMSDGLCVHDVQRMTLDCSDVCWMPFPVLPSLFLSSVIQDASSPVRL